MNHLKEALKKKYEEEKQKRGPESDEAKGYGKDGIADNMKEDGAPQPKDAHGIKDETMGEDEDHGDKVAGLAPEIGEDPGKGIEEAHMLRDEEDTHPGSDISPDEMKDHIMTKQADTEAALKDGDAQMVSKHGIAPNFMKHMSGKHVGRGAMSLHERAAGSMKEKMAAIEKRKKGF
jgi:hypothetical protein